MSNICEGALLRKSEAATRGVLWKKVILKISQNPQKSKNLIFKKFADLRPDSTFSAYKDIIVLLKRSDVFLFSET